MSSYESLALSTWPRTLFSRKSALVWLHVRPWLWIFEKFLTALSACTFLIVSEGNVRRKFAHTRRRALALRPLAHTGSREAASAPPTRRVRAADRRAGRAVVRQLAKASTAGDQ